MHMVFRKIDNRQYRLTSSRYGHFNIHQDFIDRIDKFMSNNCNIEYKRILKDYKEYNQYIIELYDDADESYFQLWSYDGFNI